MKKTIKFAAVALCAAALAISCNKESIQINVEKAQPEMVTFTCQLPDTDTKVAITPDGTAGKVAWEVGDAIHIHTGHIRSGEYTTVTLTKDDISADGKTAKITFEALKKYDYADWVEEGEENNYGDYYASYPAAATSNPESCYNKSYFSKTNNILMAACDDGEGNFKFFNLCGIISFEVESGYDSYVFSGNAGETVGYSTYVVEINRNSSQTFNRKETADPKTSISADLQSGVNYICLPNGTNFTEGFTIKFKKDGEIVKVATTENGVNVARNKMLVLGDITSRLTDYEAPSTDEHKSSITDAADLSTNGTANCYIVYAAGAFKFPAVKGNNSELSVGTVFGVKLVWETYNNSEDVTANSVIEAVDYEDNWIYFKTPDTLKPGNALIAAKDSEGNIIWSWHIWIPASTIDSGTYGFNSSAVLMDRNLGALKVADENTDDAQSSGLFYQWGRKDPLKAVGSLSKKVTATTAPTDVWSAKSEQVTLADARQNPTVMYTKSPWTTDDYAGLWAESKTANDPCPAGWKIPKNNSIFEGYWDAANYDAWAWGTYGFRAGTTEGGSTVFPYSGFLYYSSGSFDYFDSTNNCFTGTRLWTYVAYSTEANYRALDVKNAPSRSGTGQRMGHACAVRCVAE